MDILLISTLVGIFVGGVGGYGYYRLMQRRVCRRAELEAQDLLSQARTEAELIDLELIAKEKEIVDEIDDRNAEFFAEIEPRIDELSEVLETGNLDLKNTKDQFFEKRKKSDSALQSAEDRFRNAQNARAEQIKKIQNLKKAIAVQAASAKQLELAEEQARVEALFLANERRRISQVHDFTISDIQNNVEFYGKNLIDQAIFRFQRAACPERGIAAVHFENPAQRQVLTEEVVRQVQTLVGCDIYLDKESDLVGVSGFDPVRRELTRRVLEKIKKDRTAPDQRRVEQTFQNEKRNLLQAIQRDGKKIAQELKMKGFHPEVEQMMGSLRYRYSFTQNQYFHCGEVGFIAGCLAGEIGIRSAEILTARRAGLLHDLGKAMDHDQDGGHAMIGANFIEARHERPEVVHAVRAHHFDETPSTDYAFLVIGADAISGSRPGARRSTVETYNQKVSDMVSIAESFAGVTECLVLSGGRECRVWVNSSKVSDAEALKMGQEITKRIENELSYPGQIKVVIIRQTTVVEQTRHA